MARRRPGDKPLSEPKMESLLGLNELTNMNWIFHSEPVICSCAVITVPADVLALSSAKTSAGTLMTRFRSHMYMRQALKLLILVQLSYISNYRDLMEVILNTLRPGQNGRHFADDTFNRIFMNENVRISIKFSLKFVQGPIPNIPALVQIMAWRHPGDKPLSEPVMVSLLTHIYVTRPQWVNDVDLVCLSTLEVAEHRKNE